MFLRCKVRRKDGKQHRYWSVVENTRTARGRVVQRHVLYLGEINDTQELAWRRSIEVLEEGATQPRTLSLFPEDRCGRSPDSHPDRRELLIPSVAQQLNPPGLANALAHAPARYSRRGPSVGIETADMLVHEVLSRPMRDRSSRSDRRNAACLTSV